MSQNDDLAAEAQEFGNPRAKLLAGRRVTRRVGVTLPAVVLADVSDSMKDRDGSPGERMPLRRIDRLAKVLDYLLTRVRIAKLICFNDLPVEVPLAGRVALPEPAGSTNLAFALEHIASLEPAPSRLMLLSDGMPNSVEDALYWGKRLRPMVLDCYYVGPEAWDPGLRFMRDLAAAGGPGGRSGHFDMLDPVLLGTELHNRLLAGPDRG